MSPWSIPLGLLALLAGAGCATDTQGSARHLSVMAQDLDELVRDFRERPLDEGPYTFVAADALTMKVREGHHHRRLAIPRITRTP